jgi:hypothetical protein
MRRGRKGFMVNYIALIFWFIQCHFGGGPESTIGYGIGMGLGGAGVIALLTSFKDCWFLIPDPFFVLACPSILGVTWMLEPERRD